jgi:hypothetical protein
MLAVTGAWTFALLGRTPDWWPMLRWVVLGGAVVLAAVRAFGAQRLGRATAAVAVATALVGLGGAAAFTIYNATQSPSGPGTMSGPGHQDPFGPGGPGPGGPGGFGGPSGPRDDTALADLVKGVDNRWAAAGIGSMTVSRLELQTGASLMAIGGFAGGDPSPTLAQFQQRVADGQVRYFNASDRGGPPGHRDGSAAEISAWVEKTFTKLDVGGTAVYDLESPRFSP